LYLKATTVGGKSVGKQLLIEVCGLETLAVQSSATYKKLLAPSSGQFEIISTTESAGWFTLIKTASNSECVVTSYGLYSNSAATTSLSSSKVIQDTTAVNNNYDIKIDRGSTLALTNIYLKATTPGAKTAIKHL
jgi:hypothetical protein